MANNNHYDPNRGPQLVIAGVLCLFTAVAFGGATTGYRNVLHGVIVAIVAFAALMMVAGVSISRSRR